MQVSDWLYVDEDRCNHGGVSLMQIQSGHKFDIKVTSQINSDETNWSDTTSLQSQNFRGRKRTHPKNVFMDKFSRQIYFNRRSSS